MRQYNLLEPKRAKRTCFFDLQQGRGRKAEFSAYSPKALSYFSKKYEIPVITEPEELREYDVVLFSLHSFRDFYRVSALEKYKARHHEWIAGGNAVTTPSAVLWLMDYVYVGDAKAVFGDILKGARDLPGMIKSARVAPVEYQDAAIDREPIGKNELTMSKGCPRRCLFCIHPWRTEYAEQDKELVLDFIKTRKSPGIGLGSNSSDDVSYYGEVSELLNAEHKTDMVISNAVQGLTDAVIKDRKREMLLGVEGMSGFLRWVINKPIHRELLYEKMEKIFYYGKQVRTVYQFNLPGETDADFEELLTDIAYFRAKYKTGSWAIPFIPNQATAHTPLQWEVPKYDLAMVERIMELRNSLFGSKKSGMSIYVPAPLYPAKWFAQLIAEWIPITPAVAGAVKALPERLTVPQMVSYLESKDVKLPASFLHRTPETVFPWDIVKIRTDRATLLKRRSAMYDRMSKRAHYDSLHNKTREIPFEA